MKVFNKWPDEGSVFEVILLENTDYELHGWFKKNNITNIRHKTKNKYKMNNARYDKWKKLYQDQKFLDFNTDKALLWLKVKAISKKAPMKKFLEKNGIQLEFGIAGCLFVRRQQRMVSPNGSERGEAERRPI